jgi:hypothetical protein
MIILMGIQKMIMIIIYAIIRLLYSPRQGGSNGGQIIKNGFFLSILIGNRINSANNESFVSITT